MTNDQEETATAASIAALTKPLIESFAIEGLHGYRSLSLNTRFSGSVLIAPNGSGKTTFLGALDAFLKGQFTRLASLNFESISCRLRGVPEELKVTKKEIDDFSSIPSDSDLVGFSKSWDLAPTVLQDFLLNDYSSVDQDEVRESSVYQTIFAKSGYRHAQVKNICDHLTQSLRGRLPNIDRIRDILKLALATYEVVYLPTYRRIEISLPEDPEARPGYRKRQSVRARLGLTRQGLHSGEIQFGLADISERLAGLHRQMVFESNRGYGQISANIVNDLITGAFEREIPSLDARPSREDLHLFFSRIKEEMEGRHFGPYQTLIPNIDAIYSGAIPAQSEKFLTYFLGKLNSVIEKTRDVESVVEEFIGNCNRYLSLPDELLARIGQAQDAKELTFDRRNLRVTVTSKALNRKVPLDSLSSGEKQMISLFARLYLYPPKRKIVLIDEPELSLSIDWQKKILPDILGAPSCEQLIAITHSPFVFENELEPFATTLKMRIMGPVSPSLYPEEDEGQVNE